MSAARENSGANGPVPVDQLRWFCDPDQLDFETTLEVAPEPGVIGQDDAIEALRFGLEINAPGQNVFVRGLSGTGRLTLVRRLLDEVRLSCPVSPDRCYVHNFAEPEHPRMLELPRGSARRFRKRVDDLIQFLRKDLVPALSSDSIRTRRDALLEGLKKGTEEITAPFAERLATQGLALASIPMGPTMQFRILPVINGKPLSPEQIEQLVAQGKMAPAELERIEQVVQGFAREFEQVVRQLEALQEQLKGRVRALYEGESRQLLERVVHKIREEFPFEDARQHLREVVEDVVTEQLSELSEAEEDTFRRYRVNVLVCREADHDCPVVVETTPTLQNLFGGIEREFQAGGTFQADHMSLRAGSLLKADGGYLLLEAADIISEPGSWRTLTRALRTGQVEILSPEIDMPFQGPSVKPEPIPFNVKVILLGDPDLYYLLDAYDRDFPNLFKVMADFEPSLPRNPRSLKLYAGVLARIANEEKLLPFHRSAVATLAEHGARIAQRHDQLTTRFGRLSDLAREAAYITGKSGGKVVMAQAVTDAIRNSKRRADLPARRFRRLVHEGTIRILTAGQQVGQVNGLAVVSAGPLMYGFPARITATIGPGSAGAINIEREANLSGAIHTKGFYILGGLLRHLLRTKHPLAFSASIAFEQSYGGIDGDSASGAEMCCLLSALTDVPLRQDLAMTGAIDQHGNIQPIGAANEKIEGFFDTCLEAGLTGTQGVIIPATNVRDLMLRPDVVKACREGRFHVYAVDTIHQALELFTGMPAGETRNGRDYPEDTLLGLATRQAHEYWRQAQGSLARDRTPAPAEESPAT